MEVNNETFDSKYVLERLNWIEETKDVLLRCMFVGEILTYLLRFPELVQLHPQFMLTARAKCRELEGSINDLVITEELSFEDGLRLGELIASVRNMTAELAPFDCEDVEDNTLEEKEAEAEEKEEKADITWTPEMQKQWEKDEDELYDLEFAEQMKRWDEGKDEKDFVALTPPTHEEDEEWTEEMEKEFDELWRFHK